MLTVEEIEKILLDHFDPLRTDGFSVLGGHVAKAAQAIYEAQAERVFGGRNETSPQSSDRGGQCNRLEGCGQGGNRT